MQTNLLNVTSDWEVECSDEEFRNIQEPWEPPPDVIERLYTQIEQGQIPEMKWKSPGYRPPSPEVPTASTTNQNSQVDGAETEKNDSIQQQLEDKSDFDFMDEVTTLKLKVRNKNEDCLKGSAKKKTTSLDGVLNTMRRHNMMPAESGSH